MNSKVLEDEKKRLNEKLGLSDEQVKKLEDQIRKQEDKIIVLNQKLGIFSLRVEPSDQSWDYVQNQK